MNFNRIIAISIFTFSYVIVHATNYYFANNGKDSNEGSVTEPFQTLAQLQNIELEAGDTVFFHKGNVFRGSISVAKSGTAQQPIVYTSYGSGTDPIISGAQLVPAFSLNESKLVAQCDFQALYNPDLFINGRKAQIARHPNSDFFFADSTVMDSIIYSKALISADWNGALVVAKTHPWILDVKKITASAPGQLTAKHNIDIHSSYDFATGYGFFIINAEAAMDTAGEFYFDTVSRSLTYLPHHPNEIIDSAELTTEKNAFKFGKSVSNISIQNIHIDKTLNDAIWLFGNKNITINHCRFTNIGGCGINALQDWYTSCKYVTIANCTFSDIADCAINMFTSTNATIDGCSVHRAGLIAGEGKGADDSYVGIISGEYATVTNNRIDSVGGTGITCRSQTKVERNKITNFNLTKNDAGGIYCWSGSKITVSENYIAHGHGNISGVPTNTEQISYGIYIDDLSHSNTVTNNICENNVVGIILHNASDNNVSGNLLYNNKRTQLFVLEGHPTVAVKMSGNTIQNNTFVAMFPSQKTMVWETFNAKATDLATSNNNTFIAPFCEEDIAIKQHKESGNVGGYDSRSCNLQAWQQYSGNDLGSKAHNGSLANYSQVTPAEENQCKNSDFTSGINWWWTFSDGSFDISSAEKLSGKSLKACFGSTAGYYTGNVGTSALTTEARKNYLLRFKHQGTDNAGFGLTLGNADAPYGSRTIPTFLAGSFADTAKQYEILLTARNSGPATAIITTINSSNCFYVDDFEFYSVTLDTTQTEPFSRYRLIANTDTITHTVEIGNGHFGLDGDQLATELTLEPMHSVIAFQQNIFEPETVPQTILQEQVSAGKLYLVPNPAEDMLTITGDNELNLEGYIEIITSSGEVIVKKKGAVNAPFSIDGTVLSGTYFVRFSTNQGSVILPFVVK